MYISDAKMLQDKSIVLLMKWINVIVFLLSAMFVVLYQFVLTKREAHSNALYEIGVFANMILLSVVTGYIFYFITSVIPNLIKCKRMSIVCSTCKDTLANQLKTLISVLTREENWIEIETDVLKGNLRSISATRQICAERITGVYPGLDGTLQLNPYALFVIAFSVDNIKCTIEDIIRNGEYFTDLAYIKRVVWLKNSSLLNRITLCKQASTQQMACYFDDKDYQDDYLENFFEEELCIRLFSQDTIDKRTFIDEIRHLIRENEKHSIHWNKTG